MKVAHLIAGACCIAFCLASAPSMAAKAQKMPNPIKCISAKQPKCQFSEAFCTKHNACGNGCAAWSKCIKPF
jgi:hypothetical protein